MVTSSTDDAIVAGVRSGDEAVFAQLLDDWSRSMLLLARTFVSTEASAEEVVQDTWLAVIRGIDRFEGRSSLRTWVYRILVNTAKKRGVRRVAACRGAAWPTTTTDRRWTRACSGATTTSTQAAGGRSRSRGHPPRGPSSPESSAPRSVPLIDTLPDRQRGHRPA